MIRSDTCHQDFVWQSCRQYGCLSNEATEVIADVAGMLGLFSDISSYEVFIDIKVADDDLMFVVAEHLSTRSYYEHSYLGDFICRENEPAVFETYETGQVRESVGISINKKSDSKIITNQRTIPLFLGEQVIGVLILEKAISIHGDLPTPSLMRSSQISDIMLTLMGATSADHDLQVHEGVMFFDHEGKLLYANKYSEDLYRSFGYTTILGRHFDALNLAPQHFSDLLQVLVEKQQAPHEVLGFFRDDTAIVGSRYFRIRCAVLTELESYVIMFVDDVTQAKRFENGSAGYLVTNWEMQHRIKNNLMTVASLLRLQARQCDNEQAREIITTGVNRILALSATFDQLTRTNSAAVSVLDVIRSIRNNHLALMQNDAMGIDITVSGVDFLLDSERLAMLGLVVNELIQNAIKHAFVGRTEGRIEISIASEGPTKMIQVRDNGSGFDVENTRDGAFGLTIIRGLVQESLDGKLTLDSGEEGTTVSLAFLQHTKKLTDERDAR